MVIYSQPPIAPTGRGGEAAAGEEPQRLPQDGGGPRVRKRRAEGGFSSGPSVKRALDAMRDLRVRLGVPSWSLHFFGMVGHYSK